MNHYGKKESHPSAGRVWAIGFALLFLVLALLLLPVSMHAQQGVTNTFNVAQFPGADVGAKITAAQAACLPNTAIPCTIVIDSILAVWPQGNIPAVCANCLWMDFRTPNTFGITGLSTNSVVSSQVGIDPTSPTFGCSTGSPDNSACLQSAFNSAMAAHTCVVLPAGTFSYATTLNVNSGVNGLCLKGKGMQPSISAFSMLKYTGTGDAMLASNGTAFIFGLNWEDVGIMAGANATNGIHGTNISECTFRRVGIWTDGSHQFTNGWNLAGANIVFWDGWIVSGLNTTGTNGVRLTDSPQSPSAALYFRNADTFQIQNVFSIDGGFDNIYDVDGWHESQDVVFLLDDTNKAIASLGLYLVNTRALFNTPIATYTNAQLLKINNVAGNVFTVHGLNFDHVAYFTNQIVSSAISITMGNASSFVTMGVEGESVFAGPTTAFANTSMPSIFGLRLRVSGAEFLNASFAAIPLTTGTGADFSDFEFGGFNTNVSFAASGASSFYSLGTTPAATGNFRASSSSTFKFRNTGNSADINALSLDSNNAVQCGDTSGTRLGSTAFSSLPTANNGVIIYCSDCTVAATCAAAGTGALAKRINGAWVCN